MGDDNPYWFNDHLSRHRGIMGLLRRGYPVVPGITSGNSSKNARLAGGEHGLVEHGQAQDVAFLAPCATLIGNVQLAPNTSIFYKAILKADVAAYGVNTINSAEEEERWKSLPVGGHERKRDAGMLDAGNGINHPTIGGANGGGIYVGEGTNIQDACMVTSYEGHSTIGKYVTVGHGAHIHSATVGDESLIGMGAVLKPGCVVGSQVVERGCVVNSGEIWGGNPAKKLRQLTAEEKAKLRVQAEKYISVGNMHSHCMELGGNIPDSFLEETDLIEIGAVEDGTKTQVERTMNDERSFRLEEGVKVKIQ
jgi:carbonic anhydrase/acetyltransferase-like protein (isoleucine patch superfamily)